MKNRQLSALWLEKQKPEDKVEFTHFKTAAQFSRVGVNARLAQRLALYRRLATRALSRLAKEREIDADERRNNESSFVCTYCGIHRYHLPGEHDQCDHSPTGECSEEQKGSTAALFKAEREIAEEKSFETAVFIDKDGKETYRKSGEKSSVSFDKAEIAAAKDHILTHNHPSARGLSFQDLTFASQADLAEIRAVGIHPREGKITYLIKRPSGGWPKPDDMFEKVSYWDTRLRNRLYPLLRAGKISDDGASRAHHYALAALVSKDIGAEYRAIRIKSRAAR